MLFPGTMNGLPESMKQNLDISNAIQVVWLGLFFERFKSLKFLVFRKQQFNNKFEVNKMKSLISMLAVLALSCGSVQALDVAKLKGALASADRPAADKARDAGRMPADVLNFLGLEEGMTVLDIIASTGYYTEVFSRAVGSGGKVYMQNAGGGRNDSVKASIAERLSNSSLSNVEQLDDMDSLAPGSVDFAFTGLNLHDLNNNDPQVAQAVLAQVKAALKTGGILGVVEHHGLDGEDNSALHRMTFESAVKALSNAGFAIVAVSELLENDDDPHTVGVFDPSVRGKTDRFLIKAVKL